MARVSVPRHFPGFEPIQSDAPLATSRTVVFAAENVQGEFAVCVRVEAEAFDLLVAGVPEGSQCLYRTRDQVGALDRLVVAIGGKIDPTRRAPYRPAPDRSVGTAVGSGGRQSPAGCRRPVRSLDDRSSHKPSRSPDRPRSSWRCRRSRAAGGADRRVRYSGTCARRRAPPPDGHRPYRRRHRHGSNRAAHRASHWRNRCRRSG